MTIRSYQEKDKKAVADLWRVVFPDDPPWNVPEEDIERKLRIQPELFQVAEDRGTIVGTVMGGYDGHRGWVYLVAVLPDYRKKGVGRMLMKEVERRLIEIGCPKLNLQVRGTNKGVVKFYKKLGYIVEDRVSMSKRLK